MSGHETHADYNAIADRIYIEGWALALIFGAVDQALSGSWLAAILCAIMSAFCQFVVIRWSAWIKAHPDNSLLRTLNQIARDARWWVVTLMVFMAYLALSPHVYTWVTASPISDSRHQTKITDLQQHVAPLQGASGVSKSPGSIPELTSDMEKRLIELVPSLKPDVKKVVINRANAAGDVGCNSRAFFRELDLAITLRPVSRNPSTPPR
jgi:hypothetical protein